MKEYGTFRVDGTTWRVVGAGIPEPGEYFTGNTRPDVFKAAQGIYERIPRVIVERVKEEKPPCEHENAVRVSYANGMWACGQCQLAFHPKTFRMKDVLGIDRRWREIAKREPAFGELYVKWHQGKESVCGFDGGSYSSLDTIVRPADEAS